MEKSILKSQKVASPRPGQIMSQGVKVTGGTTVYTSGQVARNSQGEVVGVEDAGAQTRQVLENLKSVLAEAGATLDDIVKVVVYVTNVDDFAEVHRVRTSKRTIRPAPWWRCRRWPAPTSSSKSRPSPSYLRNHLKKPSQKAGFFCPARPPQWVSVAGGHIPQAPCQ